MFRFTLDKRDCVKYVLYAFDKQCYMTNISRTLIISLFQSCPVETMRASVVLLFAFLALALVVAYAADEVSVYDNNLVILPGKLCNVKRKKTASW